MLSLSHLTKERIVSISEIQKNPSKALQGITRIMRGSKTVGFYISLEGHTKEEYDDLLEGLEAASSSKIADRLAKAKKALKEKTGIPFAKVAKSYGL